MEQKKILWIVAALGIFLLVIFLGTLIIYSPQKAYSAPIPVTPAVNSDTWVNTHQNAAQATTPTQNQPVVNGTTVPLNENQNDTINTTQDNLVQSGDVTVISQGTTTVLAHEGVTTIDLTQLQDTKTVENIAKAEPAVRPITTRTPSSSQEAPAETKKEVQPVATVTPTVAAPKAPTNQYWVQAASYVSRQNADNARNALLKQKIPAEVFTHTGDEGVQYYRVRVGPYTTKSEAEYWNALIKTVDNFADAKSYVTNTAKPAQ